MLGEGPEPGFLPQTPTLLFPAPIKMSTQSGAQENSRPPLTAFEGAGAREPVLVSYSLVTWDAGLPSLLTASLSWDS